MWGGGGGRFFSDMATRRAECCVLAAWPLVQCREVALWNVALVYSYSGRVEDAKGLFDRIRTARRDRMSAERMLRRIGKARAGGDGDISIEEGGNLWRNTYRVCMCVGACHMCGLTCVLAECLGLCCGCLRLCCGGGGGRGTELQREVAICSPYSRCVSACWRAC